MPHNITENEPLAPYTTLGVGGNAEYFTNVSTDKELREALIWAKENGHKTTFLGGGSNVLIDDAGVSGLVLRSSFGGISYEENIDNTFVKAGSGLMFDLLIKRLVSEGFVGLENLSGIPTTVGGVPIQNVGAYGVEAKDVVKSVCTFDVELLENKTFLNQECEFGYRDSVFKSKDGKKYFVTHVVFKVSKTKRPNILYKDLQEFFKENKNPSIQEVRNAVCYIRAAKFPEMEKVGTAGSFFKNPIISKEHFQKIKNEYPNILGYEDGEENIKISLGWILDHICDLRGYTENGVGLHKKQALVLVCKKGTSSKKINKFAEKISNIVLEKTDISITREVISL